MRQQTYIATMVVFAFFWGWAPGTHAQPGRKQVEEGNQLFGEEKYDEAANMYQDALTQDPESPIIHFNIGDTQYKKGKYEEAVAAYQKMLTAADPMFQSQAYYNIGNTLYKMGKLVESIGAYKKALQLNPEDTDAKYNLEYVRAKLKQESQKQQQNPQQQQQQDQQQQSGEQNQDQDQEQQDKQQSEGEQDQQEQQQDQQNKDDQQDQQEADQEKQQAQQPKEGELSKEDAQRILDSMKKDEKDLLEKKKAPTRGGRKRSKDW